MKITFLGATREVTGSCYVIETVIARFLVNFCEEGIPDSFANQRSNSCKARKT